MLDNNGMDRKIENPTGSSVWTVLEHEHGGLEVWDCEAFGPWKLMAGPFTGDAGYAQACEAYRSLNSSPIERNGMPVPVPAGAIAWKFADPTEDGRWIYAEDDAAAIAREDPSLLARTS